jgi:hypothetical protein
MSEGLRRGPGAAQGACPAAAVWTGSDEMHDSRHASAPRDDSIARAALSVTAATRHPSLPERMLAPSCPIPLHAGSTSNGEPRGGSTQPVTEQDCTLNSRPYRYAFLLPATSATGGARPPAARASESMEVTCFWRAGCRASACAFVPKPAVRAARPVREALASNG